MTAAREHLAFGDFLLDGTRRRLTRRDGTEVALSPRLFNALCLLVARPGELVDKRELMQALWPSAVVEENSLSQVISGLRRALGDDGEQCRLIRTEHRRGFRFVAPVDGLPVGTAPAVAPATAHASTLAVLPFVNLTNHERDALLEVGMADSLIARLSTSPRLVVRSVGSVRHFAGRGQDALQAGRLLNVDWIVDGSLQRDRERLRVTARLVSVPTGATAWSGQFEDDSRHVFEIQDAIGARAADALRLRVHAHGASTAGGDLGGTRDFDAYQLYLAGLQHAQSVRADGLQRAVELFEQAVQHDPAFALAHVGVAEACRRSIFGADRAPESAFALSRRHTDRALALTPSLAEAHTQLGWLRYWCDRDWGGAEQAFRHAIALNPSAALARFGLGFMLVVIGRCDEGLQQVQLARELDPMSLLICAMEGSFLFGRGDHANGTARLERVLEIEPRFWIAHLAMAQVHATHERLDEALTSVEQAERFADQSTQPSSLKGVLLARAGNRGAARDVLTRLEAMSKTRYVPPSSLAAVHAALGDPQRALDELERACAARDVRTIYLKDDPRWAPLRQAPRFQSLLVKMRLAGLPPGCAGP